MKTISFGRFVNSESFEKKMRGSSLLVKSSQAWSDSVLQHGLFIDLSKVEFAEFSTLAQIALLIEGAVRHGIAVKIALPLLQERKGEEEFINKNPLQQNLIDKVRHRILRRNKAFRFMQVSGFLEAIKVAHVPNSENLVSFEYEYDRKNQQFDEREKKSIEKDKFNYLLQQIYPMQWFEPQNGEDLAKSENFAAAVLGLNRIGLNTEDAKVLAGTLLDELVENVYFYADDSKYRKVSCRPYALVGAIVLDHGYQFNKDNYHDFLVDFISEINTRESKVVRVVVGDSGLGIPKVLGNHFVGKEDEIPTFNSKKATIRDKILLWSLNRWSTSDLENARVKRGTRGLWRINRFVRSYSGFLTVRSEDSLIAYLHGLTNSSPYISTKKPKFLHGTFVDVCILPNLRSATQLNLKRKIDLKLPDFEVIHFKADVEESIPVETQQLLLKRLAKSGNKSKCIILAIDNIPLDTSKNTQSFFLKLLELGADFANPSALVLVLLNANWKQIEASFESAEFFYKSLQKSKKKLYSSKIQEDPIFVIDSLGNGKWVRGSDSFCSFLNELSITSDYKFHIDEISLLPDHLEIVKQISDQPDIIDYDKNYIALRFSTRDILEQLILFVSETLSTKIKFPDNKSVIDGLFRIPTLEIVDKWIDLELLLEQCELNSIVAFSIASSLKIGEGEAYKSNCILARVDNTSYKLTDQLGKCIGTDNRVISFNGGLGIFDNEKIKTITSNQEVIVCCDVIITGNTLKHILSKLIRWKVRSISIVCVFDARSGIQQENDIELMGRKFRVISLKKINIRKEDTHLSNVSNIDPVLRKPTYVNLIKKDNLKIPTKKFLEWCENEEETIYIGHIEGATGKHFLSYLNGQKTISEKSSIKNEIIKIFTDNVEEFLSNSQKIEIWYPTPDKYAKLLAESLKNALTTTGNIKLRKIPRASLGAKWVFPLEVGSLIDNADVIIVDWGTLTSSTIQHMTRLAISAGSNKILGLIFLDQTSFDEQFIITRVENLYYENEVEILPPYFSQQIQPDLFEHSDKKGELRLYRRTVPIKIEFLSKINLRFYLPSECPLCNLQQNFQIEFENCHIPLLKEYAKKRFYLLNPLDKETIFDEKKENIYGEYLTSKELVEILEIWQILNASINSTEKRFEVYKTIDNLSKSEGELALRQMVSWIRSLSNDPNLLKSHPLRFELLRDKIAIISIKIVENSQQLSDEIIQQSLIVLRVTSTYYFITYLPKFFNRFVKNHSIIQQLLFDTYTLLNKDFFESVEFLQIIYKNLQKCREILLVEMRSESADEKSSYIDELATINSLIRIVDFRLNQEELVSYTITDIWSKLRENYRYPMRSHHEVINDMQTVYFYINQFEIPELEASKQDILIAIEKWKNCQDFLANNVFQYLYHIEDLLLGAYYSGFLDDYENFKLREIFGLGQNISQSTDKLFIMLNELYNKSESERSEFVAECINEIVWWNDFFLEPGTGKDTRLESTFLQILNRCPCKLKETLNIAINEMEPTTNIKNLGLEEIDPHCEVFCDVELLKNSFKQIIENASNDSDFWEEEILISWEADNSMENKIILTVKNSGTEKRSPNRGNGILTLNQKLKDFHGNISGRKTNEDKWSFETTLVLLKWNEN